MQSDTLNPATLTRLAACHDLLAATMPPFWHWLHFLRAAPAAELGADGHPLSDPLLPHDPALPSRMWAGGRLRLLRQPDPGTPMRRETRMLQSRESEGRSGRLRFVTLHHRIADPAGTLIEEEQDLVFRAPAPRTTRQAAPPAPASAITHSLIPDAVLLFRFSALTFNAHRIHYDRDYARAVEHYPDLVVHGPLQACLLAALLDRATPHALRRFDFRGIGPAFAGRALALEAWPDPAQPGHWHLQTRDPDGAICMTAQAEVETPLASRQKGP